jgi:hypothetical protein
MADDTLLGHSFPLSDEDSDALGFFGDSVSASAEFVFNEIKDKAGNFIGYGVKLVLDTFGSVVSIGSEAIDEDGFTTNDLISVGLGTAAGAPEVRQQNR